MLRTEISGFWIEGFVYSTVGALDFLECWETYVFNNILTGNKIAMRLNGLYDHGAVWVENNTFYDNVVGIDAFSGSGVLRRNIIWCSAFNIAGMWCNCNDFKYISDCPSPYLGQNFSADPQFCGNHGSGNFYLQTDSPCAPGNDPWPQRDCGLIGALPVNCGSVDVKKKTWGEIKTLYQD